MFSSVVAWTLLIVVAGTGCWSASERDDTESVLARVGDEVLTESDFVSELGRRAGRARPDFDDVGAREAVLQEMVDERAQLARARSLGLEHDPAVRRDIEAVLLRHLRARELDASIDGVVVSDEDVAAYHAEHGDEFARPARVRVAIVKLALAEHASPAARERRRAQAEALRAEAAELPTGFHGFGPIAARASDHQATRYKGGDLGWLVLDERRYPLDAAVLDAAFALRSPGELAPVVDGQDGLYLVKLLEAEPKSIPPLQIVAPQIGQRLLEEGRHRVYAGWLSTLRARAGVEIDSTRLMQIELPPELAAGPDGSRPRPPRLPGR